MKKKWNKNVEKKSGNEMQFQFSQNRHGAVPRLHVGPVGCGRSVTQDASLARRFATQAGLVALDVDMSPVLESVTGNRKETYTVIRGIADYR